MKTKGADDILATKKAKRAKDAATDRKRIEIELHVLAAIGKAWVSGYFSALADMRKQPKRSRKAKAK